MTLLTEPNLLATDDTSPQVVIRYWAAARAAAGADAETYAAATVGEALRLAHAHHADQPHFARVVATCSLLVDGRRIDRATADRLPLAHGTTVEVLPPLAGG